MDSTPPVAVPRVVCHHDSQRSRFVHRQFAAVAAGLSGAVDHHGAGRYAVVVHLPTGARINRLPLCSWLVGCIAPC